MHLRGAYSMMSFHSLLSIVPQSPLVAASFWNHLREDITFSLIEVRPLILDLEIVSFDITTRNSDHDYLNTLSIILGKIINVAFDHSMSVDEWKEAYYMLGKWAMGLPVQLKPFSKAHAISGMGQTFPSVRFLQPYHGKSSKQPVNSAKPMLTSHSCYDALLPYRINHPSGTSAAWEPKSIDGTRSVGVRRELFPNGYCATLGS